MKGRYKDMKKIMVLVAGILAAAILTGCGEESKAVVEKSDSTIRVNEIQVECIEVEEIQVEEILTEHVLVEDKYIDSEYESELNYNSQKNNW